MEIFNSVFDEVKFAEAMGQQLRGILDGGYVSSALESAVGKLLERGNLKVEVQGLFADRVISFTLSYQLKRPQDG